MPKRFILILLLILLASACVQQVATVAPLSEGVENTPPAPSNTIEPNSTATITTTPDLAATEAAVTRIYVTWPATITAVDTATAAFSLCPGAPGPYASIGSEVTVVAQDVDKLKLRSAPDLSPGNVLRELDRFTKLRIIGGPVCVRAGEASYWFWQVDVIPGREMGWVAEGDVTHSFIMASVGGQYHPVNTPTAPAPSACPSIRGPYGPGVQATVMTENSDKLKLRSEAVFAPDTVISELDQFTKLEIVGGPLCVQSTETGIGYWLWKVKVVSSGKTGWVAEGDGRNHFIEPMIPP